MRASVGSRGRRPPAVLDPAVNMVLVERWAAFVPGQTAMTAALRRTALTVPNEVAAPRRLS
jgi:hypothetical protein